MSSSTSNRETGAIKGGTGTTPTPANSGGASGRRRRPSTPSSLEASPSHPYSHKSYLTLSLLITNGQARVCALDDLLTGGINIQSSGSGAFAGLMGQKRNSSDEAAAARKASFDEQKPAPGIIGSLWNSFTRGSGSNPNAGGKQQEKP